MKTQSQQSVPKVDNTEPFTEETQRTALVLMLLQKSVCPHYLDSLYLARGHGARLACHRINGRKNTHKIVRAPQYQYAQGTAMVPLDESGSLLTNKKKILTTKKKEFGTLQKI